MKHNMNRILTTMTLLVLTTMTAWADQKVNITVSPANSGTVTYAVSNGVCTLTAKPADGYYLTVENLTAVATLDGGAVQSPRRRIDVVDGTPITVSHATGDDPSGETTYTLAMPADANLNVEVTAEFQSRTSIEGATVTVVVPEGGIIYNGEEQKPAIASVVLATGATLTSADYAVSGYANNINVGNNAEVTVTGKGKYKGSATGTFTIGKADFSTVTIAAIGAQTYTGAEIKPAVTVTFNGKAVADDEYSVSYSDNINAGTATVTLTSKDKNFSTAKRKTATFKINPAEATLSFDKTELTAAVNETPEWPVLSNPQGVNVAYTSSRPEVAEVDKDGLVTMKGTGTTLITAGVNDPNYQGADASYKLIVTSKTYKLKIDGIVVTDDNREELFDKSVMFDGKVRLWLTDANIESIESGLDKLEIYLKGENKIHGGNQYAIQDLTNGKQELIFMTSSEDLGSLDLGSTKQIIYGFSKIDLYPPLADLNSGRMALNHSGRVSAKIGASMDYLVNSRNTSATVDYGTDPGDVGTSTLINTTIGNVLYTMNDTQTAGANDDGFYDGMIVLNSVMATDDNVPDPNSLIPGSEDYAKAFKGLTFLLPPGTGVITLTATTAEGHALRVKVGGHVTIIETHGELLTVEVPYVVPRPTIVQIYHVLTSSQNAPGNNHRIGPKATVSTGITGLSVSASNVDTPPGGQPNYRCMAFGDFTMPEGGVGHIIVDNDLVTDLDANSFGDVFSDENPRRAYGNYDITYIDLRGTSITGKEFSRDEAPFNELPLSTFVYLPAGNLVSGPNMVVGSVCDSLLLGSEDYTFECAAGGFAATNARFERSFDADKKLPIYLPFDVKDPDEYGTFYEFGGVKNGVVQMNKTKTVTADTPFYLKAKEGGVKVIEESAVFIQPMAGAEDQELLGTYTPLVLYDDSYVYDNSLKKFRKAALDTAAPFEAYLTIGRSEETLRTQWEGEPLPSAVDAVRNDNTETNQWYTLDGRMLQQQPTQKGVYLKNGKKHIVK